jgi:Domain of unknown function (DUF4259)
MGAWGAGSFDNDWALDWLGGLREGGDAALVSRILDEVVQHGGTKRLRPSFIERWFLLGRRHRTDWLKADVSSNAVAAAEIVAAWKGNPSTDLPDDAVEWVRQHASSFRPDLVSLAQQALGIVKTNSELQELWEEGDATEWKKAVEDLESRLRR